MKLYKAFRPLALLLFVSAASSGAFAQEESSIPYAYSVENTGSGYPAPVFPDFDRLPIMRPLPDPFEFFDGTRDLSFTSWERRRNEIKGAIEKYEIGLKPDASDLTIAATYAPPPAVGPNAGRLTVVVTRPSNGKTVTLSSKVWIPPGMGAGPFPALISMTFFAFGSNANYGSLPAAVLSTRPLATVDFVHNQVTAYSFFGGSDKANDPFYQMYPEFKAAGHADSDSGQYAAWAWGVSRLIDGIVLASQAEVNPLPIDPTRIAVTGCSYAGKMALFAGAFDERIALTIAQENGGGGAPAWRVSQEIEGNREVESLTHTDHNWFASQMFQFSRNNVYKLPHDHHELMAMVAPRALLETGNTGFLWLSNPSNYVSARAAQKVYETLGVGDRFGFIIDSGHNHCAVPTSQYGPIGAYVDKFLLGDTEADTNVRVHPYGDAFDYQRWTWWWGKGEPKFPNDWNPGNGKLVMSMTRPMDVGDGANVLAGYGVALPFAHPDSTVKLVGGSVQLDIDNPDGRCYTLTVPLPDQSYLIPADRQDWFPSPNQKSPLVWQGSAAAGFGGAVKNVVFSAVGANYTSGAGNPAGPGLATDTGYPVDVRSHADTGGKGATGAWSPTATVSDNSP